VLLQVVLAGLAEGAVLGLVALSVAMPAAVGVLVLSIVAAGLGASW
jgi:hypothetical protein